MQHQLTNDDSSCRKLLLSLLLKVSAEALSCLLHYNVVHAVETSAN